VSTDDNLFATWQAIYADKKIAIFPVHPDTKTPAIKTWTKLGLKGSSELAKKFKDARAFGYVTGRRSGVTIVDIDTTEDNVAADAINRHGQPKIIIRTASGKKHLAYRYNGERRRIRPWIDLDIDVLGDNGFAVASPSTFEKGSYEIIQGHIDDLDRLEPAKGLEECCFPKSKPTKHRLVESNPLRGMREGNGRNITLLRAIGPVVREIHLRGGDRDEVVGFARMLNVQCAEPMQDSEVERVVDSVWGMTIEGRNFIGRPGSFFCDPADIDRMENDRDALFLLQFLRRHQGPESTFMCANGLAERFGWSRQRLAKKRRSLIEYGYLVLFRPAGRGRPALFRWAYPY